jgi:16S rRNA (cytosine1402-N4)-methyltransferase
MLKEVIEHLAPRPGARILDCTIGAGGHAEALIERSLPGGMLIGIDWDDAALERARARLGRFGDGVRLFRANFAELGEVLDEVGVVELDCVLFDLGLSSIQLADAERGFSFRGRGPLDMRMDRRRNQTLRKLIDGISEGDLARIIYEYGGETLSRAIARAIVRADERKRINSTDELAEVIAGAVGSRRRSRVHPATRAFQAFRIAVNREIENLGRAVPDAAEHLSPGGCLGVISYHSGEDRIVKVDFARLAAARPFTLITGKPVTPAEEERRRNPRSRSARFRVLQRSMECAE